MKHGLLDPAGAVCEAIVRYPDKSPTKDMDYAGVAYPWLRRLEDSGLVEVTGRGHYGRGLLLTARGASF